VKKKIDETQLYPTPTEIITEILDEIFSKYLYDYSRMGTDTFNILDAGAFDGRWGGYFQTWVQDYYKIKTHATYIELLDEATVLKAGRSYWDRDKSTVLFETSFLDYAPEEKFNVVIGNPPYGKEFPLFWKKAKECLIPNGLIMWLLPTEYLNGQWRKDNVNPYLEHVYNLSRRIDFTGKGSPNRNYSFFVYNMSKITEGYTGHIL
jgi:hypothetical protein